MPLRLVATCTTSHPAPIRDVLASLSPLFDTERLFAELRLTGAQSLLRDLGFALAALLADERERVVVTTEAPAFASGMQAAVWEVGLVRDGERVLASVFSPGASPRVAQTDRVVPLQQAARAVLDGIEQLRLIEVAPPVGIVDAEGPCDAGLAIAREQLLSSASAPCPTRTSRWVQLEAHSKPSLPLSLSATVALRLPRNDHSASDLSRADLHALLFRGSFCASVGDSDRTLDTVHVYLVAEQLLSLADAALDGHEQQRGMLRRASTGDVSCGFQLNAEGQLTLLLARHGGRSGGWRLPAVPVLDFARAVVSFGRDLVRGIVRSAREQSSNLRLRAYRERLRAVADRLKASRGRRSLLNTAPESYRAFAESAPLPPVSTSSVSRLRFTESWRAAVPGIDLRSTFLCGDRLIVGSQREIACIERKSGTLLWQQPARRGASIMTPLGLARLSAGGRLTVHDYGDGEVTLELSLSPSVGGGVSGAVVNAPGLPHMLLVGEGSRHLTAIDLDSGEIRWRRTLRRSGRLRLRRAGKLIVVACGEPELVALDLLTGEEVWRHVAATKVQRGLRYAHSPVLDRGSLFVASSAPGRATSATLERIDPWSGSRAWSVQLPYPVDRLCAPLCTDDAVAIVASSEGRAGLWIYERDTGALRFDGEGVFGPHAVAPLAVDGMLIANGDGGELVALDANSATVRYRHVFTQPGRDDRPHSIAPVLRSGALFVPQHELFVLRPRDGVLVARLPSELVPDLVLVDERCGVYVAELSGHLVAYHAQPTLSLVTPS